MSYSRRQLEALGQPLGESVTSFKPGGRVYGSGGGGSGTPSTQTTITELPEWARGYAQETLGKAAAVSSQPYQTYGAERIAGFSPLQLQAQETAGGIGPAAQLGQATGLAGLAGTEAFRAGQYAPGQFTPQQVMGSQVGVPTMEAAQTGFRPDLQMYQMAAPERVRTGTFTRPGTAEQYMSPYIEQAIAPQLREAQRTSDILGTQQAGQAVQAGAFGGSRAGLLEAERQRNLGMQMGDIRARGLQSAYEQAQQLYGTEQQRALQAQLANQQAGLTAGSQNLAAALGVQQLGTQTGLQTALANLSSQQQANVQNQAAALQAQGLNAQQALQAALANQQAGLQAQQLGEQSRQYGAGLGLQGLGTALSAAGQLGQLGQQQFGQEKETVGLQSQLGAQQQALRQQGLSQAYQDFLNQQNYPYKQLGFMSDLIRGLPLGQQTARQIYEGEPGLMQSIGSLGLGAYGLKQLGMFAEGGSVTDDAFVESALDKMSDQQLAQAERVAIMRNDKERLAMIAKEKAMRASERRGLASAFNQIPEQKQQQMLQAARGGIVAFSGGGSALDAARERRRVAREVVVNFGARQRRADPEGFRAAQEELRASEAALQAAEKTYASEVSAAGLDRPVTSLEGIGAASRFQSSAVPLTQDPFATEPGYEGTPAAPAADPFATEPGYEGTPAAPAAAPAAAPTAGEAPAPAAAPARSIADLIRETTGQLPGRQAQPFSYAEPSSYLESAAAMKPERFDPTSFETEAGKFREAATRFRGGLSELEPYEKRLKEQREALGGRREENKGLVALAAAQALSKGSGFRQGIGEMFGAIGTTAAAVNKELRESERLIDQSEFALAQAKQARKDGNDTLAMQWAEKARADRNAGIALDRDVQLKAAAAAETERREERKSQGDYERTQLTVAGGIAQQIIAADSRLAAAEARALGAPMVQMAETLVPGIMKANPGLSRPEALSMAAERILESQNVGSGGAQNIRAFFNDFKERRDAGDPEFKGKSDNALRVLAIQRNADVQGKIGGEAALETKLQTAFARDPKLKEISEARGLLRMRPQQTPEIKARMAELDREEDEVKARIRREVTGAGGGGSGGAGTPPPPAGFQVRP
jgi:hypothetical protein